MENVFFKPWVGRNYQDLLVLGESHYCNNEGCSDTDCGNLNINDDICRNFTINMIKQFIAYHKGERSHARWMNTFTKFANVLHNKYLCPEEMSAFWQTVVFYNYLQFDAFAPRKHISSEKFTDSEIAFFQVLHKYKPTKIIVWGKRLWYNLPNTGQREKNTLLKDLYSYSLSSGEKVLTAYVYHPSCRYFTYDAHEYLSQFLMI